MDKDWQQSQTCSLLSGRILKELGRVEIIRNDRTAEKEVCL